MTAPNNDLTNRIDEILEDKILAHTNSCGTQADAADGPVHCTCGADNQVIKTRTQILNLLKEVLDECVGDDEELPERPDPYDELELGKLKHAALNQTLGRNQLRQEIKANLEERLK